jgi:arsenate reductase (thioredoxin)
MKKRVLILCTGNSARSQMAEGLLRHDAGDRFEVESAGTRPGHVRPEAIAVMKELGIDISAHRSKHVQEFERDSFDYVLTVCDSAKESCPVFPGHSNRIHKGFEDPAEWARTRRNSMTEYRLVVGVLGIIFDEDSEEEVKRQFNLFVKQSKTARSASVGTSVTLFRNGEIIAEYHPPDRE